MRQAPFKTKIRKRWAFVSEISEARRGGESIGQIWKPGQSFKIFCHSNNPTKTKNYPEYYQSLIDTVTCSFLLPVKKGAVGSQVISFSVALHRGTTWCQEQRKAREEWSLCFLYPGHHFIPFGRQLQSLSNKPTHRLNSFYHRAVSITNPLMRTPLCSHNPWVVLFFNCLSSKWTHCDIFVRYICWRLNLPSED